MMKNHPHPGELLREDVLLPLGIEVTDAANRFNRPHKVRSAATRGAPRNLAALIHGV